MARLTTDTSQIEIDDCEIRATLLTDSLAPEPSHHHGSGAPLILHCPFCRAETCLGDRFCQECGVLQPAFVEKPRYSFERLQNFVAANPKPTLIFTGISLLALGLVYALVAVAQLPAELDRCLTANRLNDATALAEKLMLSRFGALSGKDAELYSAAFHRRALVYGKNQNYKPALSDLSKILPGYSLSAEIAQLGSDYRLLLREGSQTQETGAKDTAAPARKSGGGADIAPAKAFTASTTINSIRANSMPGLPAVVARPKLAETVKEDAANEDKEEVNSDSEEADMAQYNRHLAEYFSRRQARGVESKEPPTFSEWVQSGKADF